MIARTLRRLGARKAPWLVLLVATIVAAAAPRLGWRIPKWPETVVVVGGVALAMALGVRFQAALARRAWARMRSAERAVARDAFAAGLAWIEAGEAEQPEADALRRALARRHETLTASATESTDTATLQREALAEAVRRGWLSGAREVVLDEHLRGAMKADEASEPDGAGWVITTCTTAYAALLPLGCAQRLTTVCVAAFVGAVFVTCDALGRDDGQEAFES